MKRQTKAMIRMLTKDDLEQIDLVVIAHAIIKARNRSIEDADEALELNNPNLHRQCLNYAGAYNRVLQRLRHPAAVPPGEPLPTAQHTWMCHNCAHKNSNFTLSSRGHKLVRLVCANCREPRASDDSKRTA